MTRATWTTELIDGFAKSSGVHVDTQESACDEASQDFGHMLRGRARGVVRPETAEHVQRIVRYSRERGLPLTVRGGGMSQSGQSVPRDGLSLDLRGMSHVGEPDRDGMTISCEPGATWRQLMTKLLPVGLAPKVVPLNLHLTVGGTLSAGGFGSTSHRFGPAVSNTASATVVTASGEVVVCGPRREREVFDRVLGGVGRGGVIVAAELALRPAPARVRTFYLAYEDTGTVIREQSRLAESPHAHHLEAFCASTIHGLRKGPSGRRQPLAVWSYGLHVSVEHSEQEPPPRAEEVLADLTPTKVLHVEDDSAEGFASRYDVRFEAMRATGAWQLQHPWLECVLPLDAALRVIPRALALLPPFLGDGHRIFSLADTDRPSALAFPGRGPFVSFAVLPMGIAPAMIGAALDALKSVHDMTLSEGGTRYVSGWQFRAPEALGQGAGASPDVADIFESCLSRG
jgi:cytokinin dehydrogenase